MRRYERSPGRYVTELLFTAYGDAASGTIIVTYSDAHLCLLRAIAELLTYRASSSHTTEHT